MTDELEVITIPLEKLSLVPVTAAADDNSSNIDDDRNQGVSKQESCDTASSFVAEGKDEDDRPTLEGRGRITSPPKGDRNADALRQPQKWRPNDVGGYYSTTKLQNIARNLPWDQLTFSDNFIDSLAVTTNHLGLPACQLLGDTRANDFQLTTHFPSPDRVASEKRYHFNQTSCRYDTPGRMPNGFGLVSSTSHMPYEITTQMPRSALNAPSPYNPTPFPDGELYNQQNILPSLMTSDIQSSLEDLGPDVLDNVIPDISGTEPVPPVTISIVPEISTATSSQLFGNISGPNHDINFLQSYMPQPHLQATAQSTNSLESTLFKPLPSCSYPCQPNHLPLNWKNGHFSDINKSPFRGLAQSPASCYPQCQVPSMNQGCGVVGQPVNCFSGAHCDQFCTPVSLSQPVQVTSDTSTQDFLSPDDGYPAEHETDQVGSSTDKELSEIAELLPVTQLIDGEDENTQRQCWGNTHDSDSFHDAHNSPTVSERSSSSAANMSQQPTTVPATVPSTSSEKTPQLSKEELLRQNVSGDTVLHDALIWEETQKAHSLIDWYLKHGIVADVVDMQNDLQQTPLCLAVITNQPTVVRRLLDCGADVNVEIRTDHGRQLGFKSDQPIHFAARKGSKWLETLRELLKSSDVNINAFNSEGRSPLHCAVESHGRMTSEKVPVDSFETIRELVKHGANLNQPDASCEKTPLHYAIDRRNVQLVKLVLGQAEAVSQRAGVGSSVEKMLSARTGTGNAALHLAASMTHMSPNDKLQLIQLLLSRGADPSARNSEGQLPRELTADSEIVDRLKGVKKTSSVRCNATATYGR